ncbi:MAG TPA: hypothetical protein VEX63_10865, partial [Flavisolibacter sp.]|nr:hypothetical protein [Flavisolibacter sp.]
MKKIIQDIRTYVSETDKSVLVISMLILATLIYFNFAFGWNSYINKQSSQWQFLYWYLIFFSS